jgi:hypothetical protein
MLRVTCVLAAVVVLCSTVPAAAEVSAARQSWRERSRVVGFARPNQQLLTRLSGPGNEATAGHVRDIARGALALGATSYAERRDAGVLRQSADGWSMRVSDNGNNVHFTVESRVQAAGPGAAKPSLAQIEAMGRTFIDSWLASVVKLAPNEKLVFMGSRYEYTGSQAMNAPVRDPDVLQGWASLFGRSVGDEMIVGPGSKVVVTFGVDGAVTGFDVDWPAYAASGTTMDTLEVGAVRERSIRLKAALPQLAPTAGVRHETSFECGMYDRGGRGKRRSGEMVQPACEESFCTEGLPSGRTGTTLIVPAARLPLADDAWLETKMLCQAGMRCRTPTAGW